MARGLMPAKAALRSVLLGRAPRLGLTTAAVDVLVERAELAWLRAGAELSPPPDRDVVTAMVVCGAVAVGCSGRGVDVQLAGPGQLVGAAWAAAEPRAFRVRALVPAVVAAFDRGAVAAALELLPPERRLQVAAAGWQILSRLVADAARAQTDSLDVRVERALDRLADTFGVPHPAGGREIRLKLHVVDLAALVGATRPNVSRRFAALRRAGRVAEVDGAWVVADRPDAGRRPA